MSLERIFQNAGYTRTQEETDLLKLEDNSTEDLLVEKNAYSQITSSSEDMIKELRAKLNKCEGVNSSLCYVYSIRKLI
jgi:hypothetical protein